MPRFLLYELRNATGAKRQQDKAPVGEPDKDNSPEGETG